jgi:hypothetical protein
VSRTGEGRASQSREMDRLRRALRIAAQMVDEFNGVDLHEAAGEEYIARTGDEHYTAGEPSEDDYVSAFLRACEASASPTPPAETET